MRLHPHARIRLVKWLLLFAALAAATILIVRWRDDHRPPKPTASTASQVQTNQSSQTAGFNKQQYSINDASSLWVIVNKGRILPSSYIPLNLVAPKVSLSEAGSSENMHLRSDAAAALEKLISAAAANNIKLMLVSGYRSYATQQSVYNGYVTSQGQAYADATSARPGHSEHQTGLAADVGAVSGKCQLDPCFGVTPEGQWLASSAYKYGFIIRYQKDKTKLTGYDFEPWHIRYVGADLAAQINNTGQTLEQFFGLPTNTNYPATSYQLKS